MLVAIDFTPQIPCSEFGAKVINLKTLMKALPGLFEHSDKNVRAEVSFVAQIAQS